MTWPTAWEDYKRFREWYDRESRTEEWDLLTDEDEQAFRAFRAGMEAAYDEFRKLLPVVDVPAGDGE